MATVIKVCPGCGVPVLIKMPDHVYQQYHYDCPVEELDHEFTDLERTQLETGMCVTCLEESNESIKQLLEEGSNNE